MRLPLVLLLLLFGPLGASGCASLTVRVDIFDRDCLDEEARLDQVETAIAAQLQSDYARVRARYLDYVADYLRAAERKGAVNPSLANAVKADTQSMVEARFTGIARVHRSFLQSKAELDRAADPEKRANAAGRCQAKLREADKLLAELRQDVVYEAETFQALDEARTRGLYTSFLSVFSDPLASHVISSDARCWRSVYDKAFGRGFFGNTDIAIKMESPENLFFTVKGVRVDASKIVEATSKVFKTAVKTIAAGYGIPSAASFDTTQDLSDLTNIADIQLAATGARAKASLSRGAAASIVEAIFTQKNQLTSGTASVRKQAAAFVKRTLSANKNALVVSGDS